MGWSISILFLAGLAIFGSLFYRGKFAEIFGNPSTGELTGKLGREFEVAQRKSGYIFTPQTWSGTVEITDDVTALPWAPVTIEPGTKIVLKKEYEGNEGGLATRDLAKPENIKELAQNAPAVPTPTEPVKSSSDVVTISGRLIPKGTKDQPVCIYVEP